MISTPPTDAPYSGARIETWSVEAQKKDSGDAPYSGARIETKDQGREQELPTDVPSAGARIETKIIFVRSSDLIGAPYAWCED